MRMPRFPLLNCAGTPFCPDLMDLRDRLRWERRTPLTLNKEIATTDQSEVTTTNQSELNIILTLLQLSILSFLQGAKMFSADSNGVVMIWNSYVQAQADTKKKRKGTGGKTNVD